MDEMRIRQIARDIENYQETIENTEGALAEAERELIGELEARYGEETGPVDFPDNIVPIRK